MNGRESQCYFYYFRCKVQYIQCHRQLGTLCLCKRFAVLTGSMQSYKIKGQSGQVRIIGKVLMNTDKIKLVLESRQIQPMAKVLKNKQKKKKRPQESQLHIPSIATLSEVRELANKEFFFSRIEKNEYHGVILLANKGFSKV